VSTVRLTMAQALVRYLTEQFLETDGGAVPLFAGVWAIFGHGNVAGLGEALHGVRDRLPTYRAHNEQAMAHAAISYAKQKARRQVFACTTSIGPGATNMITAAALAHVNRLPVLFLPGDVYAGRRPDPVLQQLEDFADGTVTANDCFRPVSRYFDRIMRPEQILKALPRAMAVLTDAANCGPVTIALCQDVQAESFDYPESFFARRVWRVRRPEPDAEDMSRLRAAIQSAVSPVIIVGGGVKYSCAEAVLAAFSTRHRIPFCETQAGKGAIAFDHPFALGGVGVTGTEAANEVVRQADLIIAIGSRLQDFTTGSAALFNPRARVVQINVCALDLFKFNALPVLGDARLVLERLNLDYVTPDAWVSFAVSARHQWDLYVEGALAPNHAPTDAQVLGALMRKADRECVVVAAAGGLPGDLHRFWRSHSLGGYHVEYGFSCMGYEIAGGLGVKLAEPSRDVYVVVGDGSYLMMNSELATAVMLGLTLTVILIDNGGFGCIHRLQAAVGAGAFNNRLEDAYPQTRISVDFVAHARALGAKAELAGTIEAFEAALDRARQSGGVNVIVIETDATRVTGGGGAWWDVAVPEVSSSTRVQEARAAYQQKLSEIKGTW
jgi:3D-(3,5/4)-trihydroxycyclohexane-1,2-dione acylhydrolase (decyclizing)